jgi:hypothetical protein
LRGPRGLEKLPQIRCEFTVKTPEIIMAATGVDEITARFIHAIETGELEGDVIEVPGLLSESESDS